MKSKIEQRKFVLSKRLNINKDDKCKWDQIILHKVIKYIEKHNLRELAIYYSVNNEVDTISIIKYCWHNNIKVFLPKLVDNEMIFLEYSKNDSLISNVKYKILEPSYKNNVMSNTMQTIFIPLVACDMNLNRIGYGGGFYDKFLSNQNHMTKIALSYKIQVVKNIKKDPHDIKMDLLIIN